MNQPTEGSGSSTPSTVPMKRKRGRPRKHDNIFYGANRPVMPGSGGVQRTNMPVMPSGGGVQRTNVPVMPASEVQRTNMPVIASNKNSNPNVGTADSCADGMVGKKVTCVVEGTFNNGYLLKVQVEPNTCLKGVVFRTEGVVPVTPATDVAPQVKMIQRTDIPIPDLNLEGQILSSSPSSGQCNKQPSVAKLPVPMSEEPVLPAEVQSGISVSLENQSAPVVAPLVDLSKIDSLFSAGGIMAKIMSKPQPERTETRIPVLKPKSQIHSSVPTQCNKQPLEVKLPMSMTVVDPVIPTKLYFDSVSLENQSTVVGEPLTVVPKIVSSISAGGITPTGMSKPGPESPPDSIMSEFESDKTIEQDETMHDVHAPRQAKESNTDRGATADSQKTSEPINLIPTVENTEKDFTTGQQSMPYVFNLNELIPDEPKHSTMEINLNPEFAEHESIPSEYINNTVDNFVQMQSSLKTGPESLPASIMSDKTVKHEEKLHEVDVSRQAKESSADGGARKDSQQTSEVSNLVPTVENTDKDFTTEQQSMPYVFNLNELIPEEPQHSTIEINQNPEFAEHEPITSEYINNTADNFVQMQGSLKSGPESLPAFIMSDKTVKHEEKLHEVDVSRQAKESSADGGARKESQQTSEVSNLVPAVETEKDFTTGQKFMPSVFNLNELIPDEPKHSTMEINLNPEFAEHESVPSEYVNNTVDNFVQMQGSLKTGPESVPACIMFDSDKTVKHEEKLHEVDVSRQAKESSADGGARKDSQQNSEVSYLVPTVENTEKDFTTGQQSMPSLFNLNELIPDEPEHSTIEINQNPEFAEHESIPSEYINNTVDNFVQMQGSLKSGPESLPASIMSDKTVKHEENLHEVDVSRQAKESSADGGARKDSQQTSEASNLVPTVVNTEKDLTTGQKPIAFAYNLNELIPDEPNWLITEMQVSPETDTQEDAKSNQAITKVDTANSNGTPITGIANIPDEVPNHAVVFNHPPILYDKEHASSESKLLSKASDFMEISDPQNCSVSGAVKNVDGNQPT